MRVLLVGSGGREHALAWSIAQAEGHVELFYAGAPNAGLDALCSRRLPLDDSAEALAGLAQDLEVGFVVVGPEAPLVAGVADAIRAVGIPVFGPGAAAAQLEGSKAFAKAFMARHGVPTAAYHVFEDGHSAKAFVRESAQPWVVKADGLAGGKGVFVAEDVAETLAALDEIFTDGRFGAAGARVVLEERLVGEEVSYHVLFDGARSVPLALAQDHKRLFDGDAGPNTGGMGAYSPVSHLASDLEQEIDGKVLAPTLAGLAADALEFRGVLFIGLMLCADGPKVLEYNVRFGDPETEVILPRLSGSVLPALWATANGELASLELKWAYPAALTVVLASGSYPGSGTSGGDAPMPRVEGIQSIDWSREARGREALVFTSGARKDALSDQLVASGGRVFAVTGVGRTIAEARERAYLRADKVKFAGKQWRSDIGSRAGLAPWIRPE